MNTEVFDDGLFLVEERDQDNRVDDRKLDLANQLYVISQVVPEAGRWFWKDYSRISELVLCRFGVYIEPQECDKLLKEYGFLLKPHFNWWVALIVALIVLTYGAFSGIWTLLTSFVLLPFVLILTNGLITFKRLFYFDGTALIPAVESRVESLGSVAIIIATRNEPFQVAKMTLDSSIALRYPHGRKSIIVVDNSDKNFHDFEKWKEYCESFQDCGNASIEGTLITFIHRDGVRGFKPANLDLALERVNSEYILYLDVDSTLQEDSLMRVIPMFSCDPRMGFVQLFTVPTNAKGRSPLALVQSLKSYFLRLETGFYTHASHALFYGHNALWRTHIVRELGSCLEFYRDEVIVTEDLSMSLRARFKGYFGQVAWVRAGEWVPESLRDTEAMWLRWTVGTYQVYAKHLTTLSNIRKLSPTELMGWTMHIGLLANYGLIPVYIVLGLAFKSQLLMALVLLSLLPECIQALCAYSILSLGGMSKRRKIIKCYNAFMPLGVFVNWIRGIGLLRYVTKKKQGWTPTGKSRDPNISLIQLMKERFGLIVFGAGTFCYCFYLLLLSTNTLVESFLIAICAFYGANCLLSVYLFGRSVMQEDTEESVTKGNIKSYSDFY